MILDNFITADRELFLRLNGSESLFWDGFMWLATATWVWIPAIFAVLYLILKNNRIGEALLIIALLALTVAVSETISSDICKPFFARLRPSHDPEIGLLADVVNGYRGGRFGFISSHAANSFSATVFLTSLVRRKSFTFVLLLWAALHSFSRIYLRVHYPGDILFGILAGCFVGVLFYCLYQSVQNKYFYHSPFISNRYTASGYSIRDIQLFYIVFFLTCFFLVVGGMIIAQILHL